MKFTTINGTVLYHDTPWNNKSLKGNSLEIELIDSTLDKMMDLILDFSLYKSKESYILIASRVNASNIELKKIYSLCGFVTVEHTLDVSSFGLDFAKIDFILNRFPVEVEDYTNDDISEIENISESVFKYGRFYEDPFIEQSIAIDRSRFWIKDLIDQDVTIKVLKKKNIVVGFMAYRVKGKCAELILGGIKENYRHLAYGFWANILRNFKDFREIKTVISSSNTDILNLYSYFGFKFTNPQFGFHKHL